MADPFRLRVLEAVTNCLAAISPAGGYFNSLGADAAAPEGRVFRGRSAYGESDPLPMLSIIEDPRVIELQFGPQASAASAGDWRLLIQGWVEDDLVNPTDPAYALLADCERAFTLERVRGAASRDFFGLGRKAPCVSDIRFQRGVVRPADEISSKAYFWLPLTLTLSEDHSMPGG